MDLVEEDDDPMSAQELVQLILHPTPMTLYQAEQSGFVRLFRGYSQADSIDEMVVIVGVFFFFCTDICHVDSFSPVVSDGGRFFPSYQEKY